MKLHNHVSQLTPLKLILVIREWLHSYSLLRQYIAVIVGVTPLLDYNLEAFLEGLLRNATPISIALK
jgi:hypothetical protein